MATTKHSITHGGSTYRRISGYLAAKALAEDPTLQWFIVGSNVNPSHFFTGLRLAHIPSHDMREAGITYCCAWWNWYNDRELGRAIAYLETRC